MQPGGAGQFPRLALSDAVWSSAVSEPAANSDRFFPLIPMGLGLVLLILGSAFALVGRHQALRSEAMRSWPELEGTVTGC